MQESDVKEPLLEGPVHRHGEGNHHVPRGKTTDMEAEQEGNHQLRPDDLVRSKSPPQLWPAARLGPIFLEAPHSISASQNSHMYAEYMVRYKTFYFCQKTVARAARPLAECRLRAGIRGDGRKGYTCVP